MIHHHVLLQPPLSIQFLFSLRQQIVFFSLNFNILPSFLLLFLIIVFSLIAFLGKRVLWRLCILSIHVFRYMPTLSQTQTITCAASDERQIGMRMGLMTLHCTKFNLVIILCCLELLITYRQSIRHLYLCMFCRGEEENNNSKKKVWVSYLFYFFVSKHESKHFCWRWLRHWLSHLDNPLPYFEN